MPILNILAAIVLVGVVLWAVNAFVPMDSKISRILNAVVVIALLIWLLQGFGVLGPLNSIHIG